MLSDGPVQEKTKGSKPEFIFGVALLAILFLDRCFDLELILLVNLYNDTLCTKNNSFSFSDGKKKISSP